MIFIFSYLYFRQFWPFLSNVSFFIIKGTFWTVVWIWKENEWNWNMDFVDVIMCVHYLLQFVDWLPQQSCATDEIWYIYIYDQIYIPKYIYIHTCIQSKNNILLIWFDLLQTEEKINECIHICWRWWRQWRFWMDDMKNFKRKGYLHNDLCHVLSFLTILCTSRYAFINHIYHVSIFPAYIFQVDKWRLEVLNLWRKLLTWWVKF